MSTDVQSDKTNLAGLDYLEFWAYGSMDNPVFLDTVDAAYQRARIAHKPQYFRFGGFEFKVLTTGGGPPGIYRMVYILEVAGVVFGLCKPNISADRPAMKVEVKGEAFTRQGESRVLQLIKELFHDMGFTYRRSKAKRVDIRCDFESFTPTDVFDLFRARKLVTRARKHPVYFTDPGTVETFYCGEGGSPLQCRIYDKVAQTADDPAKRLLLEQMVGREDIECLTRVEFQLNRQCITKRYKCESIEDVFDSLNRICDDLTRDWLRIDREAKSSNTARDNKNKHERLHPIWRLVRYGFKKFASAFEDRRVKKPIRSIQTKEQQKNIVVSYVAKIAALSDATLTSSHDVLQLIVDEFRREGTFFKDFLLKVYDEKKRIEERCMESAFAFFDSKCAVERKLF